MPSLYTYYCKANRVLFLDFINYVRYRNYYINWVSNAVYSNKQYDVVRKYVDEENHETHTYQTMLAKYGSIVKESQGYK